MLLRAETKRILHFALLESLRSIHRAEVMEAGGHVRQGRLSAAAAEHWRRTEVEPWKAQWEAWHRELRTVWEY